jgi:hypothetical protein
VCFMTLKLRESLFGQRNYVSNGLARHCAQSMSSF